VINSAVPPCFPALNQGRTAWAALTGGGRRWLLGFTSAICPCWGPARRVQPGRSAAPAGLAPVPGSL